MRLHPVCILGAALLAGLSPALQAQSFPERPVRVVVAFPPGATTDVVTRIVGAKLSELWKQNVVIENRPGAGGNLGAQIALKGNPDGHTLFATSTAFAVNLSLYARPGYKEADFVPVILGPSSPNVLFVNPAVAAKDLKELLALAKTKTMSYASSGTGTTPHLSMEVLFRKLNGLEVTHIPYGPPQAVTAVVGGQVPIGSTSMPPAVQMLKANRVRGIAVTSAKRSPVLPDVPTIAEGGFQGFEDYTWIGFFAPKGTPPAVVGKINADLNGVLAMPDVRERMAALSLDTQRNTAGEFAKSLKTDIARYAKMVKESGAKAD